MPRHAFRGLLDFNPGFVEQTLRLFAAKPAALATRLL
jgi:hypothetical protein